MENWKIEEVNENLIFKFKDEIKAFIAPDGKFHSFDDITINTGNTIEKLPNASRFLKHKRLNIDI
jgi:hypothetical protein